MDAAMDAALQIRPGAGVLTVRLSMLNSTMADRFSQGVNEGIPLFTSHHRVSPFMDGSRGKNKLLGIVGHEVAEYLDKYNRLYGRAEKKPVTNRRYMAGFYSRLGIEEDLLMASLGVAFSGATVSLGRTAKGCAMLFIQTQEENNKRYLNHAWKDILNEGAELGHSDLRRLVEDIAVLTALAKANRMVMYYQICLAAHWPKKMQPKSYPTTLYSGLYPEKMELYDHHVVVPDRTVFSVQDPESRDFLLMGAPHGADNRPFPCQWNPNYPPLEYNRVPLIYEADIQEKVWNIVKHNR